MANHTARSYRMFIISLVFFLIAFFLMQFVPVHVVTQISFKMILLAIVTILAIMGILAAKKAQSENAENTSKLNLGLYGNIGLLVVSIFQLIDSGSRLM